MLNYKETYNMEQYKATILILLLLVVLDAVGDGFRVRKWQRLHHSLEALQVAVWLGMLPLLHFGILDFQWYYLWMYVLGRIWGFDLIINPIIKKPILYVGKSSWYGWFLYWVSGDGNPNRERKWPVGHFVFMSKFLALVWWVAWLLSDGNAKALFIN